MTSTAPGEGPCDSYVSLPLVDGYLPRMHVGGLLELECLLTHWLEQSDRPTIGDIGKFGDASHITVDVVDEFVLNRDTKRSAVAEFLRVARNAGGAEQLRWHVIRNARGRINKVTYRTGDVPAPGWFAFLRRPAETPRDLR